MGHKAWLEKFQSDYEEFWKDTNEAQACADRIIGKDMETYLCNECHQPLTDQEVLEARNNKLNFKEVVCDDCWLDWMATRKKDLEQGIDESWISDYYKSKGKI